MKKQNITKTLTSLAALSLTAALMLTFPGCQASRTSGQPASIRITNPSCNFPVKSSIYEMFTQYFHML